MEIALYGGSFDPIHLGHEKIIKKLSKDFDLVLVVPVINYQKKGKLLTLEERIKTVRAVIESKNVEVLDWNVSDKKITYTSYLIKKIKEKYSGNITLVVGGDCDTELWKDSEYIKSNSNLKVFPRKEDVYSSSNIRNNRRLDLVNKKIQKLISKKL